MNLFKSIPRNINQPITNLGHATQYDPYPEVINSDPTATKIVT